METCCSLLGTMFHCCMIMLKGKCDWPQEWSGMGPGPRVVTGPLGVSPTIAKLPTWVTHSSTHILETEICHGVI